MKVLFITANRIGDAILSSGVLAYLIGKYPEASFTIACGPYAADLFRAVPRLERLLVLRKRKWNLHWLWLWRECIGTKWDLIVDLRNSAVSRLLPAATRAYCPPRSTGKHKVLDNAAVLGLEANPPPPRIWTDAGVEDEADRLIPKGIMALGIGPAANWPPKQWPVERFCELARRIVANDGLMPDAKIVVCAAPHEREGIKRLLELPGVVEVISQDLLLAAACIKRCRLFVGNDSGLTHIAAAAGVPSLALFGPGRKEVYAPWGKNCGVISATENGNQPRITGISVDMAYNAARELLAKA